MQEVLSAECLISNFYYHTLKINTKNNYKCFNHETIQNLFESTMNLEFLPEDILRREIELANEVTFTDADVKKFIKHVLVNEKQQLIYYTKFVVWILEKNRSATSVKADVHYYKFWTDTELYMRDSLDSMIREDHVYYNTPVLNYKPECQAVMKVDDYGKPSIFYSFESSQRIVGSPPAPSSSPRRNRSSPAKSGVGSPPAPSSSPKRNRYSKGMVGSPPAPSSSLKKNRSSPPIQNLSNFTRWLRKQQLKNIV
jgi:hypothetical protein